MTQTQISRLCKLEPERFYDESPNQLYWEPNLNKNATDNGLLVNAVRSQYVIQVSRMAMCFWMLQMMRARFDCLYRHIKIGAYDTHTTDGPWSNPEYMALDRAMGAEAATLDEDAVIEAYIEWKQSCVAADRPNTTTKG